MYYSSTWISDPRYQPPSYNHVYSERYPYNGQIQTMSYVHPFVTFTRMESASVPRSKLISKKELELNRIFRTLWEQHVAWTRMLIISIAQELPDEGPVTERLLRNAPEMAAVFRHFYGDAVASRFNTLMTEHLVLAAQLVKDAKDGNTQAAAETEKKWYDNADEIAAFLSSINPNWTESVMKDMLHEHLRLTKEEAVFRLTKQYNSDIETFDRIEKQALEMADEYTDGIVKQFPAIFHK